MSAKEILVAARELLSDPDHWTKLVLAKTVNNEPKEPTDPEAVCWCSIGALYKVTGISVSLPDSSATIVYAAQRKLEEALGNDLGIDEFNDCSEHKEVLELFDKAIQNAS